MTETKSSCSGMHDLFTVVLLKFQFSIFMDWLEQLLWFCIEMKTQGKNKSFNFYRTAISSGFIRISAGNCLIPFIFTHLTVV